MYLDCDTTPPVRSRITKGPGGFTRKRLDRAIKTAAQLLENVMEGQIGIYDDYAPAAFRGYVIKRPGESVYFERPEPEEA
jgi:hypothetical protein